MEVNGFNENGLSEKSKEALQSETWNQVRAAIKTEIQHFTDAPEIQHFAIEKVSKNDNVYGVTWGNVVREYLKTAYAREDAQADVVLWEVTYKVLKRDLVTSFYDADGNTLFDVKNTRLAKEYEFVMKEPAKEERECQIAKQIEESGEEDLKCSGGIDEKCKDCEKASRKEELKCKEEQEPERSSELEESDGAEEVPMGTASLADIVTGNLPAPTPEEVDAAECEYRNMSEVKHGNMTCGGNGEEKCKSCDKQEPELICMHENAKPAKQRAKEKLETELKAAKEKDFAEPIINYLLKRCSEDNGLAEDVAQKHKTWEKCYSYIYSKARGQAKGNCAAVRGDVVYEWAEDYYHQDDKAEEEKKAKEAENLKKNRSEVAKKASTKAAPAVEKKAADSKKPAEPDKQEEPKPKKNSKDMDGQMDLFSLMGM